MKLVFGVLSLALCFMLASAPANAMPNPSSLEGYWKTQDGDGVVEFYPCEDRYCARFAWLKVDSPEKPSVDNKNPDESLRTRPLCGMEFMGGFKPEERAHYNGGWIYSPRHGAMFSANLTLSDANTLVVRGYMLFPIFGEDQTWHRTDPVHPWCSAKNASLEKKA